MIRLPASEVLGRIEIHETLGSIREVYFDRADLLLPPPHGLVARECGDGLGREIAPIQREQRLAANHTRWRRIRVRAKTRREITRRTRTIYRHCQQPIGAASLERSGDSGERTVESRSRIRAHWSKRPVALHVAIGTDHNDIGLFAQSIEDMSDQRFAAKRFQALVAAAEPGGGAASKNGHGDLGGIECGNQGRSA